MHEITDQQKKWKHADEDIRKGEASSTGWWDHK